MNRFLYAIRIEGTDFAKVGMAVNPTTRLRHLQTASPFPLRIAALVPGSAVTERAAHRLLAERRVRGEWFDVAGMSDDDLLDLLANCRADSGASATDGSIQLAHLREAAGLSLREIARRFHISETTVQRHETGETPLCGMHRIAYGSLYGVEPHRIAQWSSPGHNRYKQTWAA